MSRPSRAAALAVLALAAVTVTAATVVPALAATPVVNPDGDGPNHLAINDSDVAASNTTTVALDVGVAVSADSAALRADYLSGTLQQAIANANTEANRTAIRRRMLARVANASERLDERNRAAIQAFANREISAADFLRERARISSRADALYPLTTALEENPSVSPSEAVTERINSLQGRLEVMQGPISARAAREFARGGHPSTLYVEASDTGYTIASISDGMYTRETFLGSAWRPELEDQFARNTSSRYVAAKDRALELYPTIIDNPGGGVFPYGEVYRIGWSLEPDGRLTVYLNGGTTEVFREFQSRQLADFNRTEVVNRTSESVRITVGRTYETGPAAVTLSDATTGDPINGTVAIGGRDQVPVGTDGTYWFVEPRTDVTINATAGGTDLSVSV